MKLLISSIKLLSWQISSFNCNLRYVRTIKAMYCMAHSSNYMNTIQCLKSLLIVTSDLAISVAQWLLVIFSYTWNNQDLAHLIHTKCQKITRSFFIVDTYSILLNWSWRYLNMTKIVMILNLNCSSPFCL